MLFSFFDMLKNWGIPCTLREFLDFHALLKNGEAFADQDALYDIARLTLVKDEKHYDRFDLAFSMYFDGLHKIDDLLKLLSPEGAGDDWLKDQLEGILAQDEMQRLLQSGELEKLSQELRRRSMENANRSGEGKGNQPGKGSGGSGMSDEEKAEERKGNKRRWDMRNYRNLDDEVEIGTRNIKMALRRLRRLSRQHGELELDIAGTIKKTSRNSGILDINLLAKKTNNIKVLVLFDVGGSMDPHVKLCEELFSACKTEFKNLEYYYFHNCLYETCWKDNKRRLSERLPTIDMLRKYSRDFRIIFVGDATMATYEITNSGGSVEHWNEEPGMIWLNRMVENFPKISWLNPVPQEHWEYSPSVQLIYKLMRGNMYSMTLSGLDECIDYLAK